MSLQRLRTDFHFAILLLIGSITLAGIAPFAAVRFVSGQVLVGTVDLAIMLTIGLAMTYIWRGGDIGRASLVVAASITLGLVLLGTMIGPAAVLWTYPSLLAVFLLVSRGKALLAAALIVLSQLAQGTGLDTPMQMATYAVTSVVVSVIAFTFSHRAEMQRMQLQRLADHDPLTGIPNRRAMVRELGIAAAACRRGIGPSGLLVLDLDHFKRINDAFGHEAGDSVLVDLVRLVTRSTRQSDRFFRYGGEEFVLLLHGSDVHSLKAVGESLRARTFDQLRHGDERLTLSIGGAICRKGENATQWLARADAAMYRAKQQGRDCVVMDDGAY